MTPKKIEALRAEFYHFAGFDFNPDSEAQDTVNTAIRVSADWWLSKLQEAYRQGMVDADVRAYEIEKKVREEALREVEEKATSIRGQYNCQECGSDGYNQGIDNLLAAIKEGKL